MEPDLGLLVENERLYFSEDSLNITQEQETAGGTRTIRMNRCGRRGITTIITKGLLADFCCAY